MSELAAYHVGNTRIDCVQNVEDKKWTVRLVNRVGEKPTIVLASSRGETKEIAAGFCMRNMREAARAYEAMLAAFGAIDPALEPVQDGVLDALDPRMIERYRYMHEHGTGTVTDDERDFLAVIVRLLDERRPVIDDAMRERVRDALDLRPVDDGHCDAVHNINALIDAVLHA